MSKVRLGIVGLGNIGSIHANHVRQGKIPGMELAAVCDAMNECSKKYPEQRYFSKFEEMITSGEIDAVIIATPHFSHTPLGIAALEEGLHVLVEKPISVHKEDCEKLIAAHKNKNQIFAAGFCLRFHGAFKALKCLIENGELGQLRRVNWIITDWYRTQFYYNEGGWRGTWKGEGGGILLNQCPHQLDLWQWLFGMPSAIQANCVMGRYHDIEVEDDVTAMLEYKDGMTGVFVTSTGESPGANRLEIVGENGLVIFERNEIRFFRNEVPMTEHSRNSTASFDRPSMSDCLVPIEQVDSVHVEILKNFSDAILGRGTLVTPAAEGIRSVELANAMLLSTLQAKRVQLPMDGVEFEQVLKNLIAKSRFQK